MPQMMKALVKRNPEQGIWMEEVPVPEVGPNEVLIKMERPQSAALTCTSTSGTTGPSAPSSRA